MRLARAALWIPPLALLHLHHHFHGPEVDYVGLAVGAAASWAGLPGPGEPLLIAAGVLAAQHKLDIGSVVFVAWAAATAGGIVGWLIGLGAGRALVTAPGPLLGPRVRAVERGERIFERYPIAAIVLTPAWVAGINRVRGRVYQPVNAVTALLWAKGTDETGKPFDYQVWFSDVYVRGGNGWRYALGQAAGALPKVPAVAALPLLPGCFEAA